jgi:hypothetical protein
MHSGSVPFPRLAESGYPCRGYSSESAQSRRPGAAGGRASRRPPGGCRAEPGRGRRERPTRRAASLPGGPEPGPGGGGQTEPGTGRPAKASTTCVGAGGRGGGGSAGLGRPAVYDLSHIYWPA